MEPALEAVTSGGGHVLSTETGWLLSIPAGARGQYRLAQVDDYTGLRRRDFPWRAPLSLTLDARISLGVITGTWGFGLWNDPLGFGLSPVGRQPRLPAAPQAAWFFWSSPASYLSLRDDLPANGMLAQAFRSETGWRWLPAIGLALAFNRATGRKMLRRRIDEDSTRMQADLKSWHTYSIRLGQDVVQYLLDGETAFTTSVAPALPLGIVIWIDNQFAAFDRGGRIAWGAENSESGSSLEISHLRILVGD